MPLIKGLNVDRDLAADTYRRREFIITKDFVRRQEMGKEVSVRTSTMKGAGLVAMMREIAEPEVMIDIHAQQAFADAEDWVCRAMNRVFQAVLHLGFQTTALPFERQFYCEKTDSFIANCNSLAWFPAGAFVIESERVYLFRVATLDKRKGWSPTGEIDARHSGAIGFTREYLQLFSTELTTYINKLEQKAMETEEVRTAYERLGSILRPAQYRHEQLAKRIEQYNETGFGDWA